MAQTIQPAKKSYLKLKSHERKSYAEHKTLPPVLLAVKQSHIARSQS